MKTEVSEVTATAGGTCYQVPLFGVGFSGLLVRFRELDEDTIAGFESTANIMVGPPPVGRESEWMDKLQKSMQRLGANRFTVEISEHPVDPANYPALNEVKFKRMNAQLMQSGGGGLLRVQELMGKAIQVV